MKPTKFDGRLTAPLAEFLSLKVAEGVERGRRSEPERGSIPVASLEALDFLAAAAASLKAVEPERSASLEA
jgi:hypothetical protein